LLCADGKIPRLARTAPDSYSQARARESQAGRNTLSDFFIDAEQQSSFSRALAGIEGLRWYDDVRGFRHKRTTTSAFSSYLLNDSHKGKRKLSWYTHLFGIFLSIGCVWCFHELIHTSYIAVSSQQGVDHDAGGKSSYLHPARRCSSSTGET